MSKDERSDEEIRDQMTSRYLQYILNEGGRTERFGHPEAVLAHIIQKASKSADRLSKRVAWLNVILVILGALGLFVAAYGVFFK